MLRFMWSKVTATGALVLALAGAGSVGVADADPPAPPPQPKTTIDHDGTFTVGTDIVAGTYSSAGPVEDGTCYWKRVSTSGDTLDNAMTKQPQVVQILPTDMAFKTNGCQLWQITDAAPPAGLPPLIGWAKLQALINEVNGRAAQSGASQPPP
jgi:hypothetical protein